MADERDELARALAGALYTAGFTLYMVTIIEIYSVKPPQVRDGRGPKPGAAVLPGRAPASPVSRERSPPKLEVSPAHLAVIKGRLQAP